MRKILLGGLGVVVMAFGAGCMDGLNQGWSSDPIAPSAPTFEESAEAEGDTVSAVLWTTPLAEDIYVTQTISPAGGVIEIKETGLKVVFPEYAVAEETQITVKAHAGGVVAYTFSPHGITFDQAVRIDQHLQGTSVYNDEDAKLIGGYFLKDSDIESDGTAVVREILPTEPVEVGKEVQFFIDHFSGYLLGVG